MTMTKQIGLALTITAMLAAQQQQPQQATAATAGEDPVIKVDVDLVSVLASVRDKKGAFIKNLDKEMFTIFEDGKQQEIRYFARESNLPLTIGLLVDVSKSQESLIEVERRAAAAFFRSVLKQKDQAFLISFGSEAELLQDMTGSPRLLEKGLAGLRLSVPVDGVFTPGTTNRPMRGTIMFDAVYLAATEQLKREVGRKVLVIIGDGVDHGSRVKIAEAIEAAQKADVLIYSIYFSDPRYGMFGGGDGDLKKMSGETGGRVFEVRRSRSLEQIFQEIQEEMRNQYSIGYAPPNPRRDGGYRKVDVKVKNKDYRVAARKGYYAQKE